MRTPRGKMKSQGHLLVALVIAVVPLAIVGAASLSLVFTAKSLRFASLVGATDDAGVGETLAGGSVATFARSPGPLVKGKAAKGASASQSTSGSGKRLLVLGGNGFVGREVCRLAVQRGWKVTSLSRRGQNPEPNDEYLAAVSWVAGDATELDTVKTLVSENDAAVHAIGLLFDVNSGLKGLNLIVSGSKSVAGQDSTYDNITRKTAFNLIEAIRQKVQLPFAKPTPILFVSAAEAGWPQVTLGAQVEVAAPSWLKRYLVAKRAVEAELTSFPSEIRPVIYRPSLIWSWTKFDVLPVIPVFNILSAVGVPFVDKTVTVRTLSRAIVAGLEDDKVSGVQRFMQMEELEKQLS